MKLPILNFELISLIRTRIPQFFILLITIFQTSILISAAKNGDLLSQAFFTIFQVNLLIFPLYALVLAVNTLNKDLYYWEVLLSKAISRKRIFYESILFLILITYSSIVISSIFTLLFTFPTLGTKILKLILIILITSITLFPFIAIGSWIAIKVQNKISAFALSFFIWFVFVIGADWLMIWFSEWITGKFYKLLLIFYSLFHPIVSLRIGLELHFNANEMYGTAGLIWLRLFGSSDYILNYSIIYNLVLATLIFWLAGYCFKKRNYFS